MQTVNRRISKRVYPPKECLQCKLSFKPSDARQIFCSAQHRIDYNNDQRKIKTAPLDLLNKVLVKNERILTKAFDSLALLQEQSLGIDILKYEGFDFYVYSSMEILKSNQKRIYWNLGYGITSDDDVKKTFNILKK